MIIANVLSMKNRKKKAPMNCAKVVMKEGMLSVTKLTTSFTSCSMRLVRLPV